MASNKWQRVKKTAADCPRIDDEFLAEERKALGERWYQQEYFCSFEDVVGAVFSHEDIEAMWCDDVRTTYPDVR